MKHDQRVILIAEDDDAIATLLSYNLEREGFTALRGHDGDEALLLAQEQTPDLILLDWMLPKVSGLEICRRLRRDPLLRQTPIIMLTARGEEDDKLRGLEGGADDYITKPFSIPELLARIRAVLRRTGKSSDETLHFADVTLDPIAHRVARGGQPLHLGPTEFKLLNHLMRHPRRVFSREQLLDAVWGRDIYVELRTVDVHIRRLRKTMNLPGCADIIRTVRATGYALDDTEE